MDSPVVSNYPQARWAHEGGGPCLTAMWTWIQFKVLKLVRDSRHLLIYNS
jgi:hypothetical protein